MLRARFITAMLCGIALSFGSTATASLSFSQAELLGMGLHASNGFTGSGVLTASPTYGDGQPNMSGVAGATGNLNPFTPGGTAFVYYSLSAADLAVFNAAIAGGGETLVMIGHNDNNQPWDIGLWFDAGAGIVESFANLVASSASGLSLALPANVNAVGVFVRNTLSPTAADDFHASWSIPEPMTIVVWAGLFGIGALVARRRHRNVA